MRRLYSAWTAGCGLLTLAVAMACSQAGSPIVPSLDGGQPGGNTTRILGTAHVPVASSNARGAVAGASLASARGSNSLVVCVDGATVCSGIDGLGKFELNGPFSGDIGLRFNGPGSDVLLTVPNVQAGETVTITVALSGQGSTLDVESRVGPRSDGVDDLEDDLSDDVSDEAEDDLSDDDSADDVDDDSLDDLSDDDVSDDESLDDESLDDDASDELDDDSGDDDSEDDDSEDDDSEDDDSEDIAPGI
jgi:hypothetical protein